MTICAIQTTRLCKQFQGRDVLVDVQLEVRQGECLAVIGENSAGKTTLLRCLSGATRPSSGGVSWFGQRGRSVQVRRMIGSLMHESHVYPHLTVRENLVFAARMYDVVRPQQRASELIGLCGLGQVSDQLLISMSRGMYQRVAIARAVVHEPQIVLLDEPFTGLDRAGCEMLVQLFRDLQARDRTICFTTHQKKYVRQLASRVTCIHRGQLYDAEVQAGVHAELQPDAWKRQTAA